MFGWEAVGRGGKGRRGMASIEEVIRQGGSEDMSEGGRGLEEMTGAVEKRWGGRERGRGTRGQARERERVGGRGAERDETMVEIIMV